MIDDSHLHVGSPVQPARQGVRLHRVMALVAGVLGVIGSLGAVVAMVQGWLDPSPTLSDVAAQNMRIEQALATKDDDQLVSQVSRRVTELSDQFARIDARLRDVRRLDQSLSSSTGAGAVLTASQRAMQAASATKEREQLLALVDETESMALTFITVTESDDTLNKVTGTDGLVGRTKARAQEQVSQLRAAILPELQRLRAKHAR